MYADRLTRLADYIDTYVANREDWEEYFNLGSWAVKGWEQKTCGTTACAVGWGTNVFGDEGLGLHYSGNPYEWDIRYTKHTKFGLVYEQTLGWLAIREFFDLDSDDAEYLFASFSYDNENDTHPSEVVERIRSLVKNGKRV